jgi:Immunity protein Imm1
VTAANERTVCVRFDERPYEWRVITDSRGWEDLIDDVLSPPSAERPWWVHGQRSLAVGEPHDPSEASTLLLVTVSAKGGAGYYREMPNGVISGWVTRNPQPLSDPPVLAFSAQGGTTFPSDAVIELSELRRAIEEFLHTGHRPESVAWQESEWIQ